MIIMQVLGMLILTILIVLIYFSIMKLIKNNKELYAVKEDIENQDNLDLTNKQ